MTVRVPNCPHMTLTLLGTGAAEGWPAAFCRCPACQNARLKRGREIRTRSGALWDDNFKVDFGPDTLMQMQREGRDLSQLTTLVFTHGHDDHFAPAELQYRRRGFITQGPELPRLHVYANEEVHARLEQEYPPAGAEREMRMTLHAPLVPLQPVTTHAGDTLLPLPATHARGALLLRLSRGGRHVLYGHDSGPFPEETVQALAGVPLHVALLDCNYGDGPAGGLHMGIPEMLDTVRRLQAVSAITKQTQIVATHFSHNGRLGHDALVARLSPQGVQAAYDGLALTV